jgi:non-ribosomal peptide synthetase component F
MIGMLVNTLIYRFKISPGVSFTELLTIVKNQCLSSMSPCCYAPHPYLTP